MTKLYVIVRARPLTDTMWGENPLYEEFSIIYDSKEPIEKWVSSKIIKISGVYEIEARDLREELKND